MTERLSLSLVVLSEGGVRSTLLFVPNIVFAPGSSKVAAGFFGLLVYFVHNFAPAAHASSYFWSHTVYFVTRLFAFNSVA